MPLMGVLEVLGVVLEVLANPVGEVTHILSVFNHKAFLTTQAIANGEKFVTVTVAKPPILSSDQLSVNSSVKEGGDGIGRR